MVLEQLQLARIQPEPEAVRAAIDDDLADTFRRNWDEPDLALWAKRVPAPGESCFELEFLDIRPNTLVPRVQLALVVPHSMTLRTGVDHYGRKLPTILPEIDGLQRGLAARAIHGLPLG